MNDERHKVYLGDGVYACIENGMLKLTTENGLTETNVIFLEPTTLVAMDRYREWMREIYRKGG